ncbi:DUF2125 domain-containing protein [Rhodovulum sp. YNF3179]|uniref:DUF2125 domain-containing protein n=1 Tax=Rhodovulum sp. YNF3179 TaxID=3425127 RepID=UPI003D351CB5
MMHGKQAIFAFGAATLAGLPAQAEVTPQEVWAKWQDFSAYTGQAMQAGSTEMSGDTLVLENVTTEFGGVDSEIVSSRDWVRMRDLGDGTVEITMAPAQRIVGTVTPEEGETAAIDMTVLYDGARIVASGTPERLVQEFSLDRLTLADGDIAVEDEDADFSIDFTATTVAGRYIMEETGAEAMAATGNSTLGALEMEMTGTDPESGADFTARFDMSDVAADFSGNLLNIGLAANPFASGAAFSVDMTSGASSSVFEAVEDGDTTRFESRSSGGGFGVALSPDALRYTLDSRGIDYTLSSSELPFPELSASIAETGFDLNLPLSPSEEPRDFNLLVKLRDLVIDDRLWGMIDPAGNLEHSPATLLVDLSGKVQVLMDMLARAEDLEDLDKAPGELRAISLNDLELALGGARLTGSGSFTFDPEKAEVLDGIRQPAGAIDLRLVGGNALLDALSKMGIVGDSQVMNARMMLAMFAVPGDGEDTLTSTIEMTEEGKILANGNPLN